MVQEPDTMQLTSVIYGKVLRTKNEINCQDSLNLTMRRLRNY